jgi:hypothetical protein
MFKKVEDTKYLKSRYVYKNVEIGIYPAMFGWRVQGGIVNSGFYDINYCCGQMRENVELVLTLVKHALEKHDFNFRKLPIQTIKPISNDFQFMVELSKAAGPIGDLIRVPDLDDLRNLIMVDLFPNESKVV